MCNTYGTWLPGDPRGFRTRHHREHVEGDYRNPPPAGRYEKRYLAAKASMTRAPVHLAGAQHERAVDEIVKSLLKWQIAVAALSIDRVHVHILAQFPAHNPRHYVGLAKKESSAYMRRDGLAPYGGLWARSCECKPIVDGTHHHNVLNYIIDHGKKGAVVWSTPPVTELEIDIDPDSLLVE